MSYLSALLCLALIFVLLVFVEVIYTYMHYGFGYGFSSNRDPSVKPRDKLGLRIQRTLQNHVENMAMAVPILSVAAISGFVSGAGETAAFVYVLARLAFVALYYAGVPFIRALAWTVGNLSMLYILYLLVSSGTVSLL